MLALILIAVFLGASGINATAEATPLEWFNGAEVPVTGHSFTEEYWTNASVVLESENGTTTFAVNYINTSQVQVFMVAANMHHNNATGENGTLPFQFFGMHYDTPNGTEVFIVSVLAFLYAFNDTYNDDQGLPDPGNEPFFYIFPFG